MASVEPIQEARCSSRAFPGSQRSIEERVRRSEVLWWRVGRYAGLCDGSSLTCVDPANMRCDLRFCLSIPLVVLRRFSTCWRPVGDHSSHAAMHPGCALG